MDHLIARFDCILSIAMAVDSFNLLPDPVLGSDSLSIKQARNLLVEYTNGQFTPLDFSMETETHLTADSRSIGKSKGL